MTTYYVLVSDWPADVKSARLQKPIKVYSTREEAILKYFDDEHPATNDLTLLHVGCAELKHRITEGVAILLPPETKIVIEKQEQLSALLSTHYAALFGRHLNPLRQCDPVSLKSYQMVRAIRYLMCLPMAKLFLDGLEVDSFRHTALRVHGYALLEHVPEYSHFASVKFDVAEIVNLIHNSHKIHAYRMLREYYDTYLLIMPPNRLIESALAFARSYDPSSLNEILFKTDFTDVLDTYGAVFLRLKTRLHRHTEHTYSLKTVPIYGAEIARLLIQENLRLIEIARHEDYHIRRAGLNEPKPWWKQIIYKIATQFHK